jgi:hypothetical protein
MDQVHEKRFKQTKLKEVERILFLARQVAGQRLIAI